MSFTVSVNFSRIVFSLAMTPPSHSVVANQPAGRSQVPKGNSLRQLKPLEAIELFLDAALVFLARRPCGALADPTPFLHQQFLVLAVGLEIDGGDDVRAYQHRQREVAEQALFLGHIGLETVAVIEEQFSALALDNQGIERRENVDEAAIAFASQRQGLLLQYLRARPML